MLALPGTALMDRWWDDPIHLLRVADGNPLS